MSTPVDPGLDFSHSLRPEDPPVIGLERRASHVGDEPQAGEPPIKIKHIDLFDPSLLDRPLSIPLWGPFALLGIVLATAFVLSPLLKGKERELTERVRSSELEVNQLRSRLERAVIASDGKTQIQLEQALGAEIEGKKRLLQALGMLEDRRTPLAPGFAAFSKHPVPGLWLTRIQHDRILDEWLIEGKTARASGLTEWIRRLSEDPQFAGRAMSSIQVGNKLESQGPSLPNAKGQDDTDLAFRLVSRVEAEPQATGEAR